MTDHTATLDDGSVLNLQSEDNNLTFDFGISINPGPPSEGQNYNMLRNKPQINSVTLEGNVSLPALDLRAIRNKTTAEWNSIPMLISEEGAIYIYSDYKTIKRDDQIITVPGIKIGDGNAYVIDLPFISDPEVESITTVSQAVDRINGILEERIPFWDNKVTTMLNPDNPEELIFTKL